MKKAMEVGRGIAAFFPGRKRTRKM